MHDSSDEYIESEEVLSDGAVGGEEAIEDDFIDYSSGHDFGEDEEEQLSAAHELEADDEGQVKKEEMRKAETDLLFHVQELGGIDKAGGREFYEPTPYTENGLRDLIKLLKEDDFGKPVARFLLLKWEVPKTNLVPLVLTQRQNKTILYRVLTLFSFLLEPTTQKDLAEFKGAQEFLELLGGTREALIDQAFITALVTELSDIVRRPENERTETETNCVEFIVTFFRNILSLPIKGPFFNPSTTRLLDIFGVDGGALDAMVYLTQDINKQGQRHTVLFTEIIAALSSRADIRFVMEGMGTDEVLKRVKEINRLKQIERRQATLSTRHSRFGALITVKDSKGGRRFVSNPKLIHQEAKNEVINKFYKPKAWAKEKFLDGGVRGLLNETIRERPGEAAKKSLRTFYLDFLKHSLVPLTETFYQDVFASGTHSLRPSDFLCFFEMLSFGIKAALGQKREGLPPFWLVRCLGVLYIDIAFAKLTEELGKKKKEANYQVAAACYAYLVEALRATLFLGSHENPALKHNAKILEKVIFSKDFTRVFRELFELFGRRIPRLLLVGPSLFYRLLANQGRNKVLTLRTQRTYEDDVPDEEDDLEGGDRVVYQERKFNYVTEISAFVTPVVIEGYLECLGEEAVMTNPKEVTLAFLDFLTMVVDDLGASWAFFQIDFLEKMEAFVSQQAAAIASDETLGLIKKKILHVFSEFQQACTKNTLLPVEALFRWRNFSEKESILSNYSDARILPGDQVRNQPAGEIITDAPQVVTAGSAEVWTYEEDLQLVEAYYRLQGAPNLAVVLGNILNSSFANYKSVDQISSRIARLGLEKMSLEAAKQKIAGRKRQPGAGLVRETYARFCKRNKEDLVASLTTVVEYLHGVFGNFERFKEADPSDISDYSIVPSGASQAAALTKVTDIFEAWGFLRPTKGVLFWRIPYHAKPEALKSALEEFFDAGENFHKSGGKRTSEEPPKERRERQDRPHKKPQKPKNPDGFINDSDEEIAKRPRKKASRTPEDSEEEIELKIESEESEKEAAVPPPSTHKSDNLFAMMTGQDPPEESPEGKRQGSSGKRRLRKLVVDEEPQDP